MDVLTDKEKIMNKTSFRTTLSDSFYLISMGESPIEVITSRLQRNRTINTLLYWGYDTRQIIHYLEENQAEPRALHITRLYAFLHVLENYPWNSCIQKARTYHRLYNRLVDECYSRDEIQEWMDFYSKVSAAFA